MRQSQLWSHGCSGKREAELSGASPPARGSKFLHRVTKLAQRIVLQPLAVFCLRRICVGFVIQERRPHPQMIAGTVGGGEKKGCLEDPFVT